MPCIVPIIEGDAEMDAVPLLLRRILHRGQLWHWSVSRPIQAQNLSNLKKKLERFLAYARDREGCRGILILLDMDDGCPAEEADILAGLP